MAGMYKIVPVRLGEGLLTRFLYVKEHRDQGSELAGRDLFVSNTADMSAEEVAGLFGGCGAIEEVTVGAHLKGRGALWSRQKTRCARMIWPRLSTVRPKRWSACVKGWTILARQWR